MAGQSSLSELISFRASGAFLEQLDRYAESCNCNRSQAARIIIETFLGSPTYSRESIACQAAIREGLLVGYAASKNELEHALARGVAQIEVMERAVYRDLHRAGSITPRHQASRIYRDLEASGDLAQIDEKKAREAKQKGPRARRLTPEEQDAERLLGAAPELPGAPKLRKTSPRTPMEAISSQADDALDDLEAVSTGEPPADDDSSEAGE